MYIPSWAIPSHRGQEYIELAVCGDVQNFVTNKRRCHMFTVTCRSMPSKVHQHVSESGRAFRSLLLPREPVPKYGRDRQWSCYMPPGQAQQTFSCLH